MFVLKLTGLAEDMTRVELWCSWEWKADLVWWPPERDPKPAYVWSPDPQDAHLFVCPTDAMRCAVTLLGPDRITRCEILPPTDAQWHAWKAAPRLQPSMSVSRNCWK